MLSKIKIAIGIAVTTLIAFLGALLKIRTSERDTAAAERDKAIDDVRQVAKANESHIKAKEVDDAIEKAVEDTRNTPVKSRRAELLKQARDYHGDGDSD